MEQTLATLRDVFISVIRGTDAHKRGRLCVHVRFSRVKRVSPPSSKGNGVAAAFYSSQRSSRYSGWKHAIGCRQEKGVSQGREGSGPSRTLR